MAFASDCVGAEAEAKSKALKDGEVLLLENVRFHPEEEKNDEAFSKQLAALCDGVFVCDAFGSAHRAHARVVGITRFVKQSAAGLLMEKELAYIGKAISNPTRPFVAILGGAKVSDKIEVVENLMKIADAMLIGGGMAYTFLKAQGLPIGKSLVEDDKLDLARKILADAKQKNFKFLLPVDHVIAPEFKADAPATTVEVNGHSRGSDGPRHRPENDRCLCRRNRQGQNDRLEWPDGRLRNAGVCEGHARNRKSRRGRHQRWRNFHRRRGRFRRRRSSIRPGRQNLAHFHRRRRIA